MKALRYVDSAGHMILSVVDDKYELTRDEDQRRKAGTLWFEGLYEALGAKDQYDRQCKNPQPKTQPWVEDLAADNWPVSIEELQRFQADIDFGRTVHCALRRFAYNREKNNG